MISDWFQLPVLLSVFPRWGDLWQVCCVVRVYLLDWVNNAMERAIWLLTPQVDLSATDPTAASFSDLQDENVIVHQEQRRIQNLPDGIGATHQRGAPTYYFGHFPQKTVESMKLKTIRPRRETCIFAPPMQRAMIQIFRGNSCYFFDVKIFLIRNYTSAQKPIANQKKAGGGGGQCKNKSRKKIGFTKTLYILVLPVQFLESWQGRS